KRALERIYEPGVDTVDADAQYARAGFAGFVERPRAACADREFATEIVQCEPTLDHQQRIGLQQRRVLLHRFAEEIDFDRATPVFDAYCRAGIAAPTHLYDHAGDGPRRFRCTTPAILLAIAAARGGRLVAVGDFADGAGGELRQHF